MIFDTELANRRQLNKSFGPKPKVLFVAGHFYVGYGELCSRFVF